MTSPVRDDTQPGMSEANAQKPPPEGLREAVARVSRFRSCPVGSVASLYPHQINGGWSSFANDLSLILSDREALKARLEVAEGLLRRFVEIVPPNAASEAAHAFLFANPATPKQDDGGRNGATTDRRE